MASAFSPFPERSMPFAVLAKPVDYGNGLVVSREGHIVTDRGLTRGCQVIVAAGLGNAERVADDDDNGLALLRVYGAAQARAGVARAWGVKRGRCDAGRHSRPEGAERRPQAQGGQGAAAAATAIELRQPVPMAGFSGAAALDGQGRFLGMMEMRSAVLASAEPAAPPVRLVTAATDPRFPRCASCKAGDRPRHRRQGCGGARDLREEINAAQT